jgi:phage FluMu gp28-like protein
MSTSTVVEPDDLDKIFKGTLSSKKVPKKKIKKKKKSKLSKKSKGPLIVSKKSGEEAEEALKKWLATEAGFIEGFTSDVYDNPSRLYRYQIKYLEDPSYFIHIDKGRQTGFSYVYACRSLAKSHLSTHHTSIFISINQEEANEKIVYAKGLHDSLPLSIQKKLVVDNKHALEFESSNGSKPSRTRILSYAQREPRGKGGNVDVYLDEAAHYTWGDSIYVASVPIITRGSGTLTIGSTPLGKKGIHYEISSNSVYKKIYSYHLIYWWNCIEFTKPGTFKKAQKEAPLMTTQERVLKFGSEKLMAIFISMDIDQFKQEYEIYHVDESVSFFPIDLINQCVYEIVIDDIFLMEEEDAENALNFPIMEKYGDIDFKLYEELEDLQLAVQAGKVRGKLLAGYDVGRKKHAGEFAIVEEFGEDHGYLQVVRLLKTFKDVKFRLQKEYLKKALDSFSGLRMKIDSGGIGANLGEDLSDYSWRVDAAEFTNQWKEESCSDFRIRLENQTIAIPNRKDVKNQIHSIKRKITESGKFVFDAEKNNFHHGDLFWAINMASSLGEKPLKRHIILPGSKREVPIPLRIIPIAQARAFGSINKPHFKGILDISHLKRPEIVTQLHNMGG